MTEDEARIALTTIPILAPTELAAAGVLTPLTAAEHQAIAKAEPEGQARVVASLLPDSAVSQLGMPEAAALDFEPVRLGAAYRPADDLEQL